jgi:hypothetical protein
MAMASKNAAAATPSTDAANTLKVESDGKKSRPRLLAELALTPEALNSATARKYLARTVGELDFTELVAVMREKTTQVKVGDLSELEATLTAQAVLLDGIFNEMARRAGLNMDKYLSATDTYLRLALKAQSQCRASIEALAEIKNPRPVAFVRQQNVAVNQQVNNDRNAATAPHAREEKSIPTNELSGVGHELLQNTGTPALAGRANTPVETVGKIYRATDRGRQSHKRR